MAISTTQTLVQLLNIVDIHLPGQAAADDRPREPNTHDQRQDHKAQPCQDRRVLKADDAHVPQHPEHGGKQRYDKADPAHPGRR